jgi:hypothetical protein
MGTKNCQIRLLRTLCDLDEEIAAREISCQEIPEAIEVLRTSVKEAEAEESALQTNRRETEKKRALQETELEAERERLAKSRGRQLEVKTNKEYTALLHEIEGQGRRIDELETSVLELMERVEAFGGELKEKKAEVAKKEAHCSIEVKAKEEELGQIRERLSGLQGDRKRLLVDVAPAWFEEYERVRKGRTGRAVVPLDGEACSGCHRNLPPQLAYEVRHGEEIHSCPYCNRFLCVPEETQAPSTPGALGR